MSRHTRPECVSTLKVHNISRSYLVYPSTHIVLNFPHATDPGILPQPLIQNRTKVNKSSIASLVCKGTVHHDNVDKSRKSMTAHKIRDSKLGRFGCESASHLGGL